MARSALDTLCADAAAEPKPELVSTRRESPLA